MKHSNSALNTHPVHFITWFSNYLLFNKLFYGSNCTEWVRIYFGLWVWVGGSIHLYIKYIYLNASYIACQTLVLMDWHFFDFFQKSNFFIPRATPVNYYDICFPKKLRDKRNCPPPSSLFLKVQCREGLEFTVLFKSGGYLFWF